MNTETQPESSSELHPQTSTELGLLPDANSNRQDQTQAPQATQDTPSSKDTPKPGSKAAAKTAPKIAKDTGYKVIFEGEAAEKLQWLESQLRERSAKPDLGQILGKEILEFEDQKWSAIIEENTEMDYFFSQIRKIKDKPKALKLLKGLSEKLLKENEGAQEEGISSGLTVAAEGVLLSGAKGNRKKAVKSEDALSEAN